MTYLVEAIRRLDTGEKQVRRVGEYGTRTEAIQAAQHVVDAFLLDAHRAGMSAAELYMAYETAGEAPVIFNDRDGMQSSIWFDYAEYARFRIAIAQADEIEAVADAGGSDSPGAGTARPPETCSQSTGRCGSSPS